MLGSFICAETPCCLNWNNHWRPEVKWPKDVFFPWIVDLIILPCLLLPPFLNENWPGLFCCVVKSKCHFILTSPVSSGTFPLATTTRQTDRQTDMHHSFSFVILGRIVSLFSFLIPFSPWLFVPPPCITDSCLNIFQEGMKKSLKQQQQQQQLPGYYFKNLRQVSI